MNPCVIRAISNLVAYNWADEERDYNECLDNGNSRKNHIFTDLTLIQRWLEAEHGYPHIEPRIIRPEIRD